MHLTSSRKQTRRPHTADHGALVGVWEAATTMRVRFEPRFRDFIISGTSLKAFAGLRELHFVPRKRIFGWIFVYTRRLG